MRRFVFGAVLIFALAGCAHTPDEVHAYCERWSAKFVNYGAHDNPDVYRKDLISTCMALKDAPYDTQQHSQPRITPTLDWVNSSVPKAQYTKTLGQDKMNCIERSYVGQTSQKRTSGQISGLGSLIGGSKNENYDSAPTFNDELFMACMNAAGWERGVYPASNPDPLPPVGSEADPPADLPASTGPGSELVYAAFGVMGNSSAGTMISGAGGR